MKRDERLYPLSWNHHHGLVFARRLRRGVEDEGTPNGSLVQMLRDFWRADLDRHFRAEEEILVPAVQEAGNECEEEIRQMFAEHRSLRALRDAALSTGPERVDETLVRFADLLTEHIRFEERILFEKMQGVLADARFDEVGRALNEALPDAETGRAPVVEPPSV